MRQQIYGAPLDVPVLFALHPLLEARSDNPRIEPLFDNAGDHIYWGSGVPSANCNRPALSLNAPSAFFLSVMSV